MTLPRFFQPRSLVIERILKNTATVGVGKLQANWEEPYFIIKSGDLKAYYLQT